MSVKDVDTQQEDSINNFSFESQMLNINFVDSGIKKQEPFAAQICQELMTKNFPDHIEIYTDASVDSLTHRSGFGIFNKTRGLGLFRRITNVTDICTS